ncbi:MAG: molybdopterin-dependent oxidoreductase [Actinomycetota bacterium]|nr:MAG: formate dehydrogenase alpha [Actinomycetota bacterium]MDO8950760.1 molybdopterin-dependent oxidoreductase [Actinomycetota bacterium]MDP3630021.1 molybdopterin-dependent oxidoreductase [Actinomycetota bacterium]
MTNNWVDLDNSTMFFVCGANPAENHPASIGHLNTARFDVNARGRNAALVVVDPRQTRTARMINSGYDSTNVNDMRKHDRFVRIRPGTNIAFINGVLNSIITWMYANSTSDAATKFFAWHNGTAAAHTSYGRQFTPDDGHEIKHTLTQVELTGATYTDALAAVTVAPLSGGWPKYCDSRVKVDTASGDYKRVKLTTSTGIAFSNMPEFAANIDDPDCVFQLLKTHVAKYPAATVAAICGCTEADIAAVRDAFIANSRFASSDFAATSATITAAGYRTTCIMYAMGATQFTSGSQGVRSYAIIQTLMGNMGRAGGGINALRGIHNVQGSTDMGLLFDLIPAYSGNPAEDQSYADYSNKLFGNRVKATTLNGVTPTVTKSAYTEADIEWQQRGFYNMTREWFGSRTITGATTDAATFDKLYDCWPKGNGVQHIAGFRRMCATEADVPGAEYHYTPVVGAPRIAAAVVWGQNPAVTEPNQGAVRAGLENLDLLVVTDMFATETAQCKRKATGVTYLLPACSHVEEAGSVASSGRWIQWRDRACAPKGKSKSDLELLHRFAYALNTAGAFSHIKAQWAGTTIETSDAYNVLWGKYGWDGTGSFEAVSGRDYEGVLLTGSEYVAEQIFKEMCAPLDGYSAVGAHADFVGGHKGTMWIYSGANVAHGGAYNPDSKLDGYPAINAIKANSMVVTGHAATTWAFNADTGKISRASASSTLPENTPVLVTYDYGNAVSGWTAVANESVTLVGTTGVTLSYKALAPAWAKWDLANRAKVRKGAPEHAGPSLQFHRYGWAWLLNRRVMYNNGELPGEVADVFVAPGYLARLWTIGGGNTLADWSWLYRTYNQLKDVPDAGTGVGGNHVFPGRFPAYTEPYETPYDGTTTAPNLVATWGRNTSGTVSGVVGTTGNLVFPDTLRGTAANFPLVLTTIRCVEHFQGGPITRNNPWNVELEPDPWVEINSVDAVAKGIKDGDWVNITTARGDSLTSQNGRTIKDGGALDAGTWNRGFKARVGVGPLANQRVAPGTVAIPWHWGDRGLGVGARANDLCIDAWDVNTMIPEYKACLCSIEKIVQP